MQKQNTQQSGIIFQKQSSKTKQKFKQMLANSKQYETLCLNQSQLKHMHAIRPYCSKERKSSRRQRQSKITQSPYEMSRSNSKRLDNSHRKSEQAKPKKNGQHQINSKNKQMSDMLSQLINLKSQYKILKGNYSKLLSEKQLQIKQQEQKKIQVIQQLQKKTKQVERYQKSTSLLEQQIDRIKKQCSKIIQMERFKIKKLEQTLQEKGNLSKNLDLMIAFLRNQVQNFKKGTSQQNQPLFFLQNSAAVLNYSYYKNYPNISSIGNGASYDISRIPANNNYGLDQDSLCLSRDKSKQMDSIIHSFLSNNEHSFQQPNFTKKDNIMINSLQESPIEPQIQIISEKSQKSEIQSNDFKKHQRQEKIDQFNHQNHFLFQNKLKPNSKKLQIIITDQNSDTQNVAQNLRQELSMETKKKMTNNSMVMCKQKKKLTAKKIKPF